MSLGIDDEVRRQQRENVEKRSTEALGKRYAAQNRDEIEAMDAKMAPPIVFVAQCQTCQSEYRAWIERRILSGISYSAISNSLPPDSKTGKQIDRRSIANHAKSHMPLDKAVVRAVLEEEASLLSQNWEEGVRGAFTNRGALNTLIRKAYEDAMNGVTTVEPRDLVQMMKLYNEMDASASSAAMEEAQMAVRIMTESIQNVLTDLLDSEQANELKRAIVSEVKRLRERDEIQTMIENNIRSLPKGD